MKEMKTIPRLRDVGELKILIREKQDEFLDIYSFYLTTGLAWIKEEAILKAYELHMLDTNFTFEI